jgi:rubrerythrin
MNTLDFAINMEMEGYQYYTVQANENRDNELFTVFQILAESELNHAELIKQLKEQETLDLSNSYIKPETKSVFHNLEQIQKIHTSKQLDSYRLAVEQEEKSIKLYQELKQEATTSSEENLFDFLIKEEQQHLLLFEEIVNLLTKPEEWVEAAEFGLREEY